jgi:hypothetical protein
MPSYGEIQIKAVQSIGEGKAKVKHNWGFKTVDWRSEPNLKPIAAVSDPPTDEDDGNGCEKGPPQRQGEIGNQPENHEDDPENLLLHPSILVLSRAYPGTFGRIA